MSVLGHREKGVREQVESTITMFCFVLKDTAGSLEVLPSVP